MAVRPYGMGFYVAMGIHEYDARSNINIFSFISCLMLLTSKSLVTNLSQKHIHSA